MDEAEASEPLVFEFEQPNNIELVETPDEAAVETPPDNAMFASDKNARAQDQYEGTDLEKGLAYSDGQSEYKLFAGGDNQPVMMNEQSVQDQAESTEQENNDPAEEEKQDDIDPKWDGVQIFDKTEPKVGTKKFTKELLGGFSGQRAGLDKNFSDDVNWNNKKFSAEDLGGVSLNTYAWDFAPYILYMKKRIRNHTYPPPAFTQMGAISGEVVIRFKVHPDGSISDLRMIEYKGHKALVETSLNAVKASNPFRELPRDFPENFLELTWIFIYSILR